MTAARIREAAKVLRDAAENATPGPWEAFRRGDPAGPYGVCPESAGDISPDVFDGGIKTDATYIALMQPTVALALADWLMEEVARSDERDIYFFPLPALTLADTVLGGKS